MPDPILREKLRLGEFFVALGIQDMITAVVARMIRILRCPH